MNYRLAENAFIYSDNNDYYLIDLRNNESYLLNIVSYCICLLLDKAPQTKEDLLNELKKRIAQEINEKELLSDIESFVNTLIKIGLVI